MDKLLNILCAVGGFAFGTLGAYVNARISSRGIKDSRVAAVMGTNFTRMGIDILVLLIAFFACKFLELDLTVVLISVASGLAIFGMIFLRRLTKRLLQEEERSKDGGE